MQHLLMSDGTNLERGPSVWETEILPLNYSCVLCVIILTRKFQIIGQNNPISFKSNRAIFQVCLPSLISCALRYSVYLM